MVFIEELFIEENLENIEEDSFEDNEEANNFEPPNLIKEKDSLDSADSSKKKMSQTIKPNLSPKKSIEFSPHSSPKKSFDFLAENMLAEEEKPQENSENVIIKRVVSKRKTRIMKNGKCSFESFNIYSRITPEIDKNDYKQHIFPMPSEKNIEMVSRTGSSFHLKFGGGITNYDKKSLFKIKTKNNLVPSIEDIMPLEKHEEKPKGKNNNLEQLSDNSLHYNNKKNYYQTMDTSGTGYSTNNIIELEFDRMKVYKLYFIHNNINHILVEANSMVTRRKFANQRKSRKMIIKKACKRKIHPIG